MQRNRGRATRLAIAAVLAALVATPAALAASPRLTNRAAGRSLLGSPHAAHTRSPLKNPRRNRAPHPNYFGVCAAHGYLNSRCIKEVLAAIRHARAKEHVTRPTMILPRNFTKLSAAEQTFVVTNLERVDRGRRPFRGLTSTLNNAAHAAAVAHLDPTIATSVLIGMKIENYGSIWAGDLGPLAADYDWMYNDGYSATGGINVGCPTPSASGCWGHRDNILGGYSHLPTLTAGAGSGKPAGASLAEVLAAGRGKAPAFVYTWKQALAHGANGHRITR